MALYNNGYRLGNTPFKRGLGALTTIYNGGGSCFNYRMPTGIQRASSGLFGEYAGRPIGNLAPHSWMLPQKAGAMSMRTVGAGSMSADLIPARAMAVDMTGFGDMEATAALVVSMACAMSGSGSLTAGIVGLLNMSVDFDGSGDLSASMNGIASMAIEMLGQGDLEATIAAYGNMAIDIVVTGTGLSTANVGDSVWRYLIGGTEAQSLLQTAGSGGVDYDTLWASMPAALKESLAAYVLAAAQTAPIHSEVVKAVGMTVAGTGVPPTYDANGVLTDPGDPLRLEP